MKKKVQSTLFFLQESCQKIIDCHNNDAGDASSKSKSPILNPIPPRPPIYLVGTTPSKKKSSMLCPLLVSCIKTVKVIRTFPLLQLSTSLVWFTSWLQGNQNVASAVAHQQYRHEFTLRTLPPARVLLSTSTRPSAGLDSEMPYREV